MKCTVCTHPQLHDIDQALLAENATFAALSRKYALSISALFRHKRMLKNKMARAEERLQHLRNQEILFQHNEFLESTRQIVRTASNDGDTRQVLQAIREGTRILNFMTKLEVQFDPDTVYRLLASPQWVSQDSLLPTDPGIITGTRQALADDFFFPCPEIPPDPQLDGWDEADAATADLAQTTFLETQNVELEICSFPLEINPPNQREISAKLPKNSRLCKHNNKQYQKDTLSEKIRAKNLPPGPECASLPAVPPSCALPGISRLGFPPKTGHGGLATLTSKLKFFFLSRPKLVSDQDRKPTTTNRLLPSPITGLTSYFKKLTAKCRPNPPPRPFGGECEVICVKSSEPMVRDI